MRVCLDIYSQVLLGINWLILRLLRCIGIHHVVKLQLRGQSWQIKSQVTKDFLHFSAKATVSSACQKLLFLLQISVQISKRPLQSTPRDTLLKHCSLSGKVLSILKGRVPRVSTSQAHLHSLAIQQLWSFPFRWGLSAPISSLPKPFYGLISAEQTFLLGKYLCNLYLAHRGWEEPWPQLRARSTAQGGGRNSSTSPAETSGVPTCMMSWRLSVKDNSASTM